MTLGVAAETAGPLRVGLEGTRLDEAVVVSPGAPATVEKHVDHGGGRFEFEAALWGAPRASIWIDAAQITRSVDGGGVSP